MALRNIKITLNDVTKYNKGDNKSVQTYMWALTKKTNNEVNTIVDKLLGDFHNETISLWQLQENIRDDLGEDISSSSYKEIKRTINFGEN